MYVVDPDELVVYTMAYYDMTEEEALEYIDSLSNSDLLTLLYYASLGWR